jgi:sRNA-binding carbon storage regulator CsrA
MPHLVLTRNYHEAVVIRTPEGREITVRVEGVMGRGIKLGFTADAGVVIDREEIDYMKRKAQGNAS